MDGDAGGASGGEAGTGTPTSWDVLVDAAGGGDTTSIDTAVGTTGAKAIWIKGGTYSESVTMDVSKQHFYFEPGTILTGTLTVSADKVCVDCGCDVNLQSAITWSGDSGILLGKNTLSLDSTLTVSGIDFTYNGRGLDGTQGGTLEFSGAGSAILEMNKADATGAGVDAVRIATSTGANVKIVNGWRFDAAGRDNFRAQSTGEYCLFSYCQSINTGTGSLCAIAGHKQFIAVGNTINYGAGSEGGFNCVDADNCVIASNMVADQPTDSIFFDSNSDNNVAVGNRFEVGSSSGESIDDDGTGNTSGSNQISSI